ncbi:MAG: gfo/Idh/MocA family oxidoreductase, partial [Planctomycetia bacterium]|nr:gfo/Idh/MocA family oxidoreductase [Planctomycetia bacterium]
MDRTQNSLSRRHLLGGAFGAGILGAGMFTRSQAQNSPENIEGFDQTQTDVDASQTWRPISDRKIRMGLVGHGV